MRLTILTSWRQRRRMSDIKLQCLLLTLTICIYSVKSETQWVWSRNSNPHISGSSLNNGGIPDSQRPVSSSNDALPTGTIRVLNSRGEARLIPGAANFVSNALNNLGGGGGGSAGGNGGGGGTGLLSIGSGLFSSLLQNGPQIASSALALLFGGNRNPVSNTNNNSPTTLPGDIPSFPSSDGGSISSPSLPSSSSSSSDCQCVHINQCFLPRRPNGDCSGGNVNCCLTSTRTGAVDFGGASSSLTKIGDGNQNQRDVRTPLDVRIGLLENIVRGSSTVFDDALDLVLQPWLTQEDQQKLANRIAKNG